MRPAAEGASSTKAAWDETWWSNHGVMLLRLAVALMAVFAVLKLGDECRRLVWDQGSSGAIDLKYRYQEVHRWFAGLRVYSALKTALYPPASLVMLWPFLGWLEITPARWLWAATMVGMLVWLTCLIVKESGAETPIQRAFVALLLLSMNATGVVVGNGQLIVHLLPMVLAAILLLRRGRVGWRERLLAGSLLLATLVKPSVSVPFFWITLFSPGGIVVVVLAVTGYIALTLIAVSYQEASLTALLHEYLGRLSETGLKPGYANLNVWMVTLGLKGWAIEVSVITLLLLGLWVYRHRRVDLWLLLGVSSLAARLWAYHGVQDDVLSVLPEVTLFRLAGQGCSARGDEVVASVLLATTILVMLAPIRLYLWFSRPWKLLYTVSHTVVWLLTLVFLLRQARLKAKSAAC